MARKKRMAPEDEQSQKEQEQDCIVRKQPKLSSRNSRLHESTFVSAQTEEFEHSAPHPYNGFIPQSIQQYQLFPLQTHLPHSISGSNNPIPHYTYERQTRQQEEQMISYSRDYQLQAYPSCSTLPSASTTYSHYPTSQPPVLPSMNYQYYTPDYIATISHAADTVEGSSNHYIPSTSHLTPFSVTHVIDTGSISPLAADIPSDIDQSSSLSPVQSPAQPEVNLGEIGFQQYDRRLKATFEDITKGWLKEASIKLRVNTRWLLTSVEELGLHLDSEILYPQRLLMWREFNHCWEALAQKQRDVTEKEISTGETACDKLDTATITSMMNELISLVDRIDRFGLVDKELGVWEEQIETAFKYCLDLLEVTEKPKDREKTESNDA